MPETLFPTIPENITVHLGSPNQNAQNVTLSFSDYIKNVASNEIYPTWPDAALRANIYAIVSFALNRIYTEWYPSQNRNFDITNSTAFDQAFVKDGEIFENISRITDDLFNDYVVRRGNAEPLFTQFCNGTTSVCDGLSQWGTVQLANQGYTPLQILKHYYGDDIEIVENAPIADIGESYPDEPLKLGDYGNSVKIIQNQLNRITQNYPALPKISDPNGIFTLETQNSVREFQNIFDLSQTGEVDKPTWYKIKRYYTGVKGLSDLVSEGVSISELQVPFSTQLREGSQGIGVKTVQYYLNILAYFNGNLLPTPLDSVFGPETSESVRVFQRYYGLPVTAVVNNTTWNVLNRVYSQTVGFLPDGYSGEYAKLYPGYVISIGMQGESVRDLQTYLNLISQNITAIPPLSVTGFFGEQTRASVTAFQQAFGINATGAVGAATWNTIAEQYDFLINQQNN